MNSPFSLVLVTRQSSEFTSLRPSPWAFLKAQWCEQAAGQCNVPGDPW